jgi:putative Ca2+/H+ antiporter (TMEM165/GDT1 family)
MIIIFKSFLLILASEMGDKTQLLALVLATRFRKPWTVMAGIFVATLLNHVLASTLGVYLATLISEQTLSLILAAIFFAFAMWVLIPDKEEELKSSGHMGAFMTTAITFFLAEMGDKTQLATLALGARYDSTVLVTIGSTMGMLVADGMVLFWGHHITDRLPMKWIHRGASLLFVIFGIGVLYHQFG